MKSPKKQKPPKALTGQKAGEPFHQAWCKAALTYLGFRIWDTSQGVRGKRDDNGKWRSQGGTRTTPGLSDLIAFHQKRGIVLFFEVKPPGAARVARNILLRPPSSIPQSQVHMYRNAKAQQEFGEVVQAVQERWQFAVRYGYGSLPELVAALREVFPVAALRDAVNVVACPLDVKDGALVALSTPAGSAPG